MKNIMVLFLSLLDIYSISDDFPTSFPVGGRVTIVLDNIQFIASQQFPSFYSLSQRRSLVPSNVQHNLETGSVLITFDQAAPSLSGDHVLCVTNNILDSRRRKRIPNGTPMRCGGRININVTGTTM